MKKILLGLLSSGMILGSVSAFATTITFSTEVENNPINVRLWTKKTGDVTVISSKYVSVGHPITIVVPSNMESGNPDRGNLYLNFSFYDAGGTQRTTIQPKSESFTFSPYENGWSGWTKLYYPISGNVNYKIVLRYSSKNNDSVDFPGDYYLHDANVNFDTVDPGNSSNGGRNWTHLCKNPDQGYGADMGCENANWYWATWRVIARVFTMPLTPTKTK